MRWFSNTKTKSILLAPTLFLFLSYIIIPVGIAFYYSFTSFTGIGVPQWTGLSNYQMLFKDRIFFVALKNTGIVLMMTMALVIPGAFGLSLLLNREFAGNRLARALNFSPNIISPILVGLIWVFILDPSMGLINSLFRAMGLERWQNDWIGGNTLTPFSVAFVFTWQTLGYNATIFLAGLKMIPEDLYDAAKIDGAGKVQQLRHITLPMLRQTIIIIFLLVITGAFKIFETVYQLTNGGPNHLSDMLVTYMYFTTFNSSRFGYGMSIASVAFLISSVFAVFYIGLARERIGTRGGI